MARTFKELYSQLLSKAWPFKAWDFARTFHAVLTIEGVAADTGYILIDVSDTTNFPHPVAGIPVINNISFIFETESSGVYDVSFGVVTENDETDGSATMFLKHQHEGGSPGIVVASFHERAGLNCEVSSGALVWVVSNEEDADNVIWQDDTNRAGPAGNAMPAVGDVVMLVDEISGTGTISGWVKVEYSML